MSHIYKEIANAITQYLNKKGSLKTIIFTKTPASLAKRRSFMYFLALQTLKYRETIDIVFDRVIKKIETQNSIKKLKKEKYYEFLKKDKRDSLLYLLCFGLFFNFFIFSIKKLKYI